MLLGGLGGTGPILHGQPTIAAGLSMQRSQGVADDGAVAQAADGIVEFIVHLAQMLGIALGVVEILQVSQMLQLCSTLGTLMIRMVVGIGV